MEKKALSAKSQETLRAQTISETEPGTVVRDFETLLRFISSHPLLAAGKGDMLPIASLPLLNEQMTNPLPIIMKRPMQKSYPHLLTLFVIARAGGFIITATQGKDSRLALYEPILQQWQSFNATERYFTLLNAYLWHGSKEIVEGTRRSFAPIGLWHEAILTFERLARDGGLQVPADKAQESIIYSPRIPYYAFLELFGFITVKPGPPIEGKGWRIREMQCTPFGKAMLELLGTHGWQVMRGFDDEEDDATPTQAALVFNELQPQLQPYFPEWQRCLTFADDSGLRAGVFQFKVSLGKAWRRITIDATETLEGLSATILDAFDFDNDHLHSFEYRDRFGVTQEIHHPYMDEPPFSDQVTLSELPLPVGGRMKFVFDFGDNWEFDLTLEKIDPPSAAPVKAKVIESHGKAPKQYGGW
jgi:hypothetical protein